jgi:DNA modification methylase
MNAPTPERLTESVMLYCADCIDALRLIEADSVDSIVTDPPYGLEFMGKGWDGADGFRRSLNKADAGRENVFGRTSRRSPEYRAGRLLQMFLRAIAIEAMRVLKPGGHIIAFGGTRTYHRMACAVEDAGFEIRDMVSWLYGSGFPKSKSHLKPACEPCVLARKPMTGTVEQNVRRHKTGALNIKACLVEAADKTPAPVGQYGGSAIGPNGHSGIRDGSADHLGRWPANVLHDGSDEVVEAFPETKSGLLQKHHQMRESENGSMSGKNYARTPKQDSFGDSGSAARFFYTAKADDDDRLGSKHPTVKPLDLMQYMVRLITPPKGLVLDPFAGTGTTGEACIREGMRAILIEREPEYQDDIRRRMSLAMEGTDTRKRAAATQRNKDKPVDMGPLFGGSEASGGGRAGRYTDTSQIRTDDWADGTQKVSE